jgi:hypothetical protein
MLSFRTDGENLILRFSLRTLKATPITGKTAIERSSSAPNRRPRISCSTSGLTHVASTNGNLVSSQAQSTQCFIGTRMQQNATYSSQTSLRHINKAAGKLPSRKAIGFSEAGHFKSSLRQYRSSSILRKDGESATRRLSSSSCTRSRTSRSQYCGIVPWTSLL